MDEIPAICSLHTDPVRIDVVCQNFAGHNTGNRTSAQRIAAILQRDHEVHLGDGLREGTADACIALHAGRSHDAIAEFHRRSQGGRLVVVLTGTDLYGEQALGDAVRASLRLAWRIAVSQPNAMDALPSEFRSKARIVGKSAMVPDTALQVARSSPAADSSEVVALAHLRTLKDPLLLPAAMALLPPHSKLTAVHLGASLDEVLAGEAERSKSERWRWLGGFPREEALLRLARSRALVLTSRIEGGPNVLCEAALLDRPILATCIDGVAGILPSSHEGLFEPGDERGLCALLLRLERDAEFLERLLLRSRELAESCAPERERLAFEALLAEDGPR